MKITSKVILKTIQDWIQEKKIIAPTLWLEIAQKLNVLLGVDREELAIKQHVLAKMRELLLQDKNSKHNKVKAIVDASPEYLEMKILDAHIETCKESILIAKKRATIAVDEMKGY